MNTTLTQNDAPAQLKRALTATQVVAKLAQLQGWVLTGDSATVAIEKTFHFANYYETIAFVNAMAFIAHTLNHHPDLAVHFNRCVVRLSTHDVGGISMSDIDFATRVDALQASA